MNRTMVNLKSVIADYNPRDNDEGRTYQQFVESKYQLKQNSLSAETKLPISGEKEETKITLAVKKKLSEKVIG